MKVYAIRDKRTLTLFTGRKGKQRLWENVGWLKSSFFQTMGVKLADQDIYELVSFECCEEK